MGFYDLSAEEQIQHMHSFAAVALTRWHGSFDRLELVKYRENAVFSAVDDGGRRVALRIHRPGYHSDAALNSELQWMKALAEGDFKVPDVVPASDGQLFATVSADPVPETRQVDMLVWLDGEQVGDIGGPSHRTQQEMTAIYRQAGELAAELHLRTERWRKPDGFIRHAWDADGLVGSQPFWGRFLELAGLSAEQRGLLEKASGLARRQLSEIGTNSDGFGLIHADFVPENLLFSNSGLTLIDFDDAGFGWYMFELATALFFHLDEPNYPDLEATLFAGYRSVRNKGVSEDLLPLFLFLRSATYLGWVHTRSETETAREMTPEFIQRACHLATKYIASQSAAERLC